MFSALENVENGVTRAKNLCIKCKVASKLKFLLFSKNPSFGNENVFFSRKAITTDELYGNFGKETKKHLSVDLGFIVQLAKLISKTPQCRANDFPTIFIKKTGQKRKEDR